MTDTGFLFRASWPIRDEDLTRSQLITEASAHIDSIAAQSNAAIIGEVTWTIRGLRLIAQAAAQPLEQNSDRAAYGSISRQVDVIDAYHTRGLTDRAIALRLGCSPDAVKKVRLRARGRAA